MIISPAMKSPDHRLIRYCVDLAELVETGRVVPVVVFLRGSPARSFLVLGGERHTYLGFECIGRELAALSYEHYRDSENIVARLALPSLCYEPADRVAVYPHAVRGLATPEPNSEMKFINIHEAKTYLSKIIERVAQGETVIIGKAGTPMAVLSPYPPTENPRKPGSMKGKIQMADAFDADEDLIADLFEGLVRQR